MVLRLAFRAIYLLKFFAAHNTSKYWRSLSTRHLAKCAIFGFLAKFGERRRWNETGYQRYFVIAESYLYWFFEQIICCNSMLFTTHRNIDEICQHITERNARYSDFLPSSADDVVKTKNGINYIVSAQKYIKTGFLSKLFATIFCCSQHIEILTNFVST